MFTAILVCVACLGRALGAPFDGISNLEQLSALMDSHFARENTLDERDWISKLPTKQEIKEVKDLIALVYVQKNEDVCVPSTMRMFPALEKILTLSLFMKTMCVIHEPIPANGTLFPRLFGYAVIRLAGHGVTPIHHSSAHFESDGPVNEQAAVLFESTNSRSLVVNGISRYAVRGNPRTTCQPANTVSDAAHNTNMMFHAMLEGIFERSINSVADRYIQWHGMAETSCLQSSVFVSFGAPGNDAVYESGNVAEKIALSLTRQSGGRFTAATPRTDSTCNLVASTNVFGRVVHGVPGDQVCQRAAKKFNDRFIHIEQKMAARKALDLWAAVLEDVFPVQDRPLRRHDELRYLAM